MEFLLLEHASSYPGASDEAVPLAGLAKAEVVQVRSRLSRSGSSCCPSRFFPRVPLLLLHHLHSPCPASATGDVGKEASRTAGATVANA